jgi:hypothetical protein
MSHAGRKGGGGGGSSGTAAGVPSCFAPGRLRSLRGHAGRVGHCGGTPAGADACALPRRAWAQVVTRVRDYDRALAVRRQVGSAAWAHGPPLSDAAIVPAAPPAVDSTQSGSDKDCTDKRRKHPSRLHTSPRARTAFPPPVALPHARCACRRARAHRAARRSGLGCCPTPRRVGAGLQARAASAGASFSDVKRTVAMRALHLLPTAPVAAASTQPRAPGLLGLAPVTRRGLRRVVAGGVGRGGAAHPEHARAAARGPRGAQGAPARPLREQPGPAASERVAGGGAVRLPPARDPLLVDPLSRERERKMAPRARCRRRVGGEREGMEKDVFRRGARRARVWRAPRGLTRRAPRPPQSCLQPLEATIQPLYTEQDLQVRPSSGRFT